MTWPWISRWIKLISCRSDYKSDNIFFLDNCWVPKCIAELNSLAPGKFERNFRYVISKQILVTDGSGISCAIALIWMSLNFTDDQSTLVQVMAWCHQATSHYRSQCWPRSLSPYGVTRPQWVKQNKQNPKSMCEDHLVIVIFEIIMSCTK